MAKEVTAHEMLGIRHLAILIVRATTAFPIADDSLMRNFVTCEELVGTLNSLRYCVNEPSLKVELEPLAHGISMYKISNFGFERRKSQGDVEKIAAVGQYEDQAFEVGLPILITIYYIAVQMIPNHPKQS